MRRTGVRLAAIAAAVFTAGAVPATAETTVLESNCEIRLYTNGAVTPPFTVRGDFQLLGSLPATVGLHTPVVAEGFGVRVRLDWDVLGPELAHRGVTRFASGEVLSAHLSLYEDGVMDWPVNPFGSYGSFDVDQLRTGLTDTIEDKVLTTDASVPGHWEYGSYEGEITLAFHKLDNPQTTMIAICTADQGQDLSWADTVVTP